MSQVVCAKTELAVKSLVKAFADRHVEKVYRAMVVGIPDAAAGVWQDQIDGRAAHTSYQIIRSTQSLRFGSISELELRPHTGRTHQLRIHCARAGCPIVDDERYGGEKARMGTKHAGGALLLWSCQVSINRQCIEALCEAMGVDADVVNANCEPPHKFEKLWQKEQMVWQLAMAHQGVEHISSAYVKQLKTQFIASGQVSNTSY